MNDEERRNALQRFREDWKLKHSKSLRSKYNAQVRDKHCGELVKEYAECCRVQGINVLKCRKKWRNVLLCVQDNYNEKEFNEFQNQKLKERETELFDALTQFRQRSQQQQK